MPYEDPIVRVGLLQRALQAPGGVFRQRCSLMGGWRPDWLRLAAPSLEGMQYCRGLREAEHRRPGAGEAFLNLRDNESTFMEPGAMRQAGASLPAYSRNQRRWRSRVWHEERWLLRGAVVPHYGGVFLCQCALQGGSRPDWAGVGRSLTGGDVLLHGLRSRALAARTDKASLCLPVRGHTH